MAEPTGHLPECPVEGRLRDGKTVAAQTCICERLRRAEERVEESMDRSWERFSRDQFHAGFSAGVNAARNEAALAMCAIGTYLPPEEHNHVLAAINALREESDE